MLLCCFIVLAFEERRATLAQYTVLGNNTFLNVFLIGQLKHGVQKHILQYGAQASGTAFLFFGKAGDLLERVVGDLQTHVLQRKKVDYVTWSTRSVYQRIVEKLFFLFSPLL